MVESKAFLAQTLGRYAITALIGYSVTYFCISKKGYSFKEVARHDLLHRKLNRYFVSQQNSTKFTVLEDKLCFNFYRYNESGWERTVCLPPRTVEKKRDNEQVLTTELNVKLLSY